MLSYAKGQKLSHVVLEERHNVKRRALKTWQKHPGPKLSHAKGPKLSHVVPEREARQKQGRESMASEEQRP